MSTPAGRLDRKLQPMHGITLAVVALIWFGAGFVLVSAFTQDNPQYLPAAMSTTVLACLAITALHFGIMLLFRSSTACWGLIIGKLCALPFTFSFGAFSMMMLVFSSDSGMKAAAEASAYTVPIALCLTAGPTLLGALIGALSGQSIWRRRQQANLAPLGAPPAPPAQ